MFLGAVLTLLKTYGPGATFLKNNVKHLNVGFNGQVRPSHYGMKKSRGSAAPFSFPLRYLVLAKSILLLAIEVRIALEACLFGGLYKRLRQRIGAAQVGNMQRTIRSVECGRRRSPELQTS